MDKILKQLGCKSFNQQITRELRQMKKERVLEEQEKIKIKKTKATKNRKRKTKINTKTIVEK